MALDLTSTTDYDQALTSSTSLALDLTSTTDYGLELTSTATDYGFRPYLYHRLLL